MNSHRDKIIFFVTFFVSTFIYLSLYNFTIAREPVIGDDSLTGVLSHNPNIVIDSTHDTYLLSPLSRNIEITRQNELRGLIRDPGIPRASYFTEKGERYPVLLQDRQSNYTHMFYSYVTKGMEPVRAFTIFQRVMSIAALLLFGLFLWQIAGVKLAVLGMFLLSFDPSEIMACGPTISEPWLEVLTLAALISGLKEKIPYRILAGFILGLGMSIQVTYLWYVLFALTIFIIFNRLPLKEFSKHVGLAFIGFVIGYLPYLVLIDFKSLFSEVAAYGYFLPTGEPVIHYPLKDFIYLIIDKINFHAIVFDPNHLLANRDWGFENFKFSFSGLLVAILYLAWMFPYKNLSQHAALLKKWCFAMTVGSVVFLIAVWVCVPNLNLPSQYFTGINFAILATLLFSTAILVEKAGKFIFLLLFLPQLALSMTWIQHYRENGVIALLNANLQKKVADELVKRKDPRTFAISYGDMGTYEYLSSEKIWPIHATGLVEDTERFPTLASLLKFLKHGTMVITMNDQMSMWYPNWGAPQPEKIKAEAAQLGITISDESFPSLRPNQKVWIFSFADSVKKP